MKTAIQTFDDFLREEHADYYTGTDDDMPDDFDNWLQELDPDEWLMYAKMWAANAAFMLYQKLSK